MTGVCFRPAFVARRPRVLRELVLLGSLFFLYQQVRFLTRDDTGAAMANAHRVIGFERSLGLFRERDLQTLALRSEHVVSFLNRYYVTVHFPVSVGFVVWVLVRRPHWYRSIRTWFVVVTGAALAIHVAFPLAPPRMMTSEGLVDTLQVFGPRIYPSDTSHSVANQFAAMPSLHFGWALMVAVGLVAIKRSRWSLLAFAHPAVTLLAIVATANHYWLDAAVAAVLVCAAAPVLRHGWTLPSVPKGRDATPEDDGIDALAIADLTTIGFEAATSASDGQATQDRADSDNGRTLVTASRSR